MKTRALVFSAVLFAVFGETASTQTPTRSEILIENYQEDRLKGLVALNRRYIESFQKELTLAMKTGKLEEANWIQLKIKSLVDEIAELEKQVEKAKSGPSKVDEPDFLVGKTIGFLRGADNAAEYFFSFQKEGNALWLGTKNQQIPRNYKPTGKPREYELWWEARADSKYTILVSEDGKTAKLIEQFTGNVLDGKIERSD